MTLTLFQEDFASRRLDLPSPKLRAKLSVRRVPWSDRESESQECHEARESQECGERQLVPRALDSIASFLFSAYRHW